MLGARTFRPQSALSLSLAKARSKNKWALIPGFRCVPPGAKLCRLLRRLVESQRRQ